MVNLPATPRQAPRLGLFLIVATLFNLAVLFVAGMAQAQVILYKIALVTTFGWIGYWFDRAIAPYARPDMFLPAITTAEAIVASFAMQRRALIVGAFVLGGSLGL